MYFLKLQICMYLRTEFQVSSIIVTSFRQGDRGNFTKKPSPLKSPPRLGLPSSLRGYEVSLFVEFINIVSILYYHLYWIHYIIIYFFGNSFSLIQKKIWFHGFYFVNFYKLIHYNQYHLLFFTFECLWLRSFSFISLFFKNTSPFSSFSVTCFLNFLDLSILLILNRFGLFFKCYSKMRVWKFHLFYHSPLVSM